MTSELLREVKEAVAFFRSGASMANCLCLPMYPEQCRCHLALLERLAARIKELELQLRVRPQQYPADDHHPDMEFLP